MKICFIGFGNMAFAMAQYFIKNPEYELRAASPSQQIGQTNTGIKTHCDNTAFIPESDLVILAVKPDKVSLVLNEISPFLSKHSLLVSIVTGLSLSQLATHSPANQAIVRAMPNLPIAVGHGATPLIANQSTTRQQKQSVQELFQSAGIITWLEQEHDLDNLTALSGSGPAYLFYFLEAMINAGIELGLEASLVNSFVLQTVIGAAELVSHSHLSPHELRKKVTSAKGTTAAAIDVLEKAQFKKLVSQAIHAAKKRAEALGNVPDVF